MHRVSLRMLAALAVLIGVMGPLGTGDTPAAASNKGAVDFEIFPPYQPVQVQYGEDIVWNGQATDSRSSCLLNYFGCDAPRGYVQVTDSNGRILAAVPLVPWDGMRSYWGPLVLDSRKLEPGFQEVTLELVSDFVPRSRRVLLPISKVDCTIALTQSAPSSLPGTSVTFIARILGKPGRAGRIVFTDDDGGLLANPVIENDMAVFTTSALPQGAHAVNASWSGDDRYEKSCSSTISHRVENDPPPTAIDDVYNLEAGESIIVRPLDNDFDLGAGPLRADYVDTPDLGDAESLDLNGVQLRYTAPPGMAGEGTMHYLAYDGIGQSSNLATIRFVIGCTPEVTNDRFTGPFGTAITVGDDGIYANDQRCDLNAEVFEPPQHGELDFDPSSGGFVYRPDPGHVGPDSFRYRIVDDFDGVAEATVDLFTGLPGPTDVPPTTVPPTTGSTTTSTPASTTTTSTPATTTTTAPGSSTTTPSGSTTSSNPSTSVAPGPDGSGPGAGAGGSGVPGGQGPIRGGPGGSSPGPLSRTGSDVRTPLYVALTLFGMGVATLAVRRRTSRS